MEEISFRRKAPAVGIVVSLFSLIQGTMSVLAPALFAILGIAVSPASATYLLLLGIASLLLGYLGIKGRPTAYFFMALLCLLQSIAFRTPDAHFNFIGPVSLSFGFGREPDLEFTINVLALLFAACAALALYQMNKQQVPSADAQQTS
ncbi:hypothetical protein [Metapseudomonas resinovorans]|uniref:Uncharacterized protein n=1 Tax=Metapseudomonas resinovorans NBRC 106553 TaxID=1245471 RepID=S6ALU5_METRE|nr:hypothetical protein [Pseudomonas resinovorans]BAN46383.1 hypothetical protein PCA10_06510 [Pseudomonas resinovorans NBRC 106553]